MKISALATLLIAATAHAAETKQHVRKAEVDESSGSSGWGSWTPPTCDLNDFDTGTLVQAAPICTIVPNLPNQPGAPAETVDGIFCIDNGGPGYTLSFDAIGPDTVAGNSFSVSGTKLLRATLNLAGFTQNPAPNGETTTGPTGRRLSEEEISDRRLQGINPLLDPAVNGGADAPSSIAFQGFFDHYCNFQLVSTQGGQLTGTLNPDTSTFRVQFSQSGQVTSPVDSLGGQFSDVTGLFVSNFAFAFTGTFVPEA